MKGKLSLIGLFIFAILFGCSQEIKTKANEQPKEFKVIGVTSGYILYDDNGELNKIAIGKSIKISGNILDANEVTVTIYDDKVSKIEGNSGEVVENQIVGVGATGKYSENISVMVTVKGELKSYKLEDIQLNNNLNKLIGSKAQISSGDYIIKIY